MGVPGGGRAGRTWDVPWESRESISRRGGEPEAGGSTTAPRSGAVGPERRRESERAEPQAHHHGAELDVLAGVDHVVHPALGEDPDRPGPHLDADAHIDAEPGLRADALGSVGSGARRLAPASRGGERPDLQTIPVVRRLVLAAAPLGPGLPVLGTSGYNGGEILRRGLLEPGVAFLPEPLTTEALQRAVRARLDGPSSHTDAASRL